MNQYNFFQAVEAGAITEVVQARNQYYDHERGLTAYQRFYMDGELNVFAVTSVDGGDRINMLDTENRSIFSNIYGVKHAH